MDDEGWYNYPNRVVCTVLGEMRDSIKVMTTVSRTNEFNHLNSLIEEAQTCVNRMEASMEDWKDIRRGHEEKSKLNKEIIKLTKKRDKLKGNKK